MIVGLADAMPHNGGEVIGARQLARELGLLESESWIDALRMELEQKRWAFVDWDGDEVGFELHGEGLLEAARLRRETVKPDLKKKLAKANWPMWTLLATIILGVAALIFS